MNCPACSVDLKIAERQGVEIDYCPQCRGVWLQRGELDKIIDRALARAGPAPDRYVDNHRRDDDDDDDRDMHRRRDDDEYRKKRRKSFLGELFDFD